MLTHMPETFQKESSLDRFFNRAMGQALRLGFAPGYMRLLEVRGRKSGKTFTTPVNVLEFQGKRWTSCCARRDCMGSQCARGRSRHVATRLHC